MCNQLVVADAEIHFQRHQESDALLSPPFHLGVAGMIPTARVERGPSEAARSASKGIVPATHFSHFLKISLGSVISPIETATNSHPLAPNSFSLVCIF